MPVAAFKGVVENGAVRLCENAILPENTQVYVIVVAEALTPTAAASPPRIRSPRLVNRDQAARFRKRIVEFPGNAKV